MKIENISVSNININNGTATLTFDIVEVTTNVNVNLKIDDGDFIQIATNQGQGKKTYNLTSISRGVHNLILKISNEEEEYISEPFLVKFKINPTIEGLACVYSDSTGKFILKFTIIGDELFTYNVNFKLDNNEYQEIMTSQIMGEKTFESTSVMGNHTCSLKVSDGYDEYETSVYSFEITNQKPILSKVLVTDITNNGTASIHYAVKDIENSTLTHKLNNTAINPTRVDNFYTYEISGLSVGAHTYNISVTDGIDTVTTDNFSIEIFANSTNKKETLRQAKVRYDFAYQSLKDIIMSVVSDGTFNYDIENTIIQKAQESYNETYSEFNRIAQQSIDIIGTNKVNLTKEDLTNQINDVDDALNSLETTMEGVFRDGLLSDSEKTLLKDNLNLIAKEKTDVDKDYETLYNNEDLLDPAKSKLQTTYNAFVNAQNSLATTINNIINKNGIIDNTDKTNIDNAFEAWRTALGNYRNASLEAIDSIAKKKIDDNADTLNEKWSELIVDVETGIRAEVGTLEKRVNTISESVDVAIKNVEVMYYLSTSETSLKGGSWVTNAPTWTQGKYMWSKTVTTLSNDEIKESSPVCIAGAKGQDATTYYTWIMYADDASGNGISNSPDGKMYIGFAYNKTSKTESTNKSDYSWSLIKGTDGTNGINGTNGKDGTTYYTWIKYSNYADGSSLYDTPNSDTKFIGIAVNKTSQTESTNKSDYSWSKFKGDDGVDGETYYTWIKYADDSSGNGLSDSPNGKKYIGIAYNKTTQTESTNKTDYTWSLIKGENGSNGTDGSDGVGIESITEQYYLSTSKTTQTEGSWVTSPPTWSKGKYMWTRSKIVYTNGVTEYTDPICDTSWEVADEVAKEVEEIDKKVASLEITNESITSTVSSMQSSVDSLNSTVSNHTSQITQLSNSISSTVTEDDVKSIIEQSPTEIKYGFNDISDYVTISTSGLTVSRGSIACDMITNYSSNAIIRLFKGNGLDMAIDATSLYETGVGDAIRLKRDSNNYVYVGNGAIGFYCSGSGNTESAVASIYGASSNVYCAFQTKGGTLALEQGHLYVNSVEMSNVNHTHSAYSLTSHTHSNYASSSHSHSEYASSSHSHSGYYGYDDDAYFYNVRPTSKNDGYCGSPYNNYWYGLAGANLWYSWYSSSLSSLSVSSSETTEEMSYEDISKNALKMFFGNFREIVDNKGEMIRTFDTRSSTNDLVKEMYDSIFVENDDGVVFAQACALSSNQSDCLSLLIQENESLRNEVEDLTTRISILEEKISNNK